MNDSDQGKNDQLLRDNYSTFEYFKMMESNSAYVLDFAYA